MKTMTYKHMGIKVKVLSRTITIFMIICVMLILNTQMTTISKAETAAKATLNIGDYVQFGKYYNKPILWMVINKKDDGSVMLFSEKIICFKAFDANGDLTNGMGDANRIRNGSNNWEKSNIREWLGSSSLKVNYSHQPPDKAHIVQELDTSNQPYKDEAGFLYNFTTSERAAIQPVTRKCRLAEVDKAVKDGGSEPHYYRSEIEGCLRNYDNSYYKNITDSVFLLDIKEINDYLYNRGGEFRRGPTVEALINSGEKYGKQLRIQESMEKQNTIYWDYWLNTPLAEDSSNVRFISHTKEIYDNKAFVSEGIAPALYLKSGINTSGGTGSIDSPYIVTGTDSTNKSTVKPNAPTKLTTTLNIGEYVQFGKYYNKPILWRVINKKDDGSIMLFSEKIICFKAFDANGDLTDGRGDKERKKYGSNYWEKSNIREWLRSSSLKVNYSHQQPDKAHLVQGSQASVQPYANEAGFLYNFTASERVAIQPVTRKCVLAGVDKAVKDGGSEIYRYNWLLSNFLANYDNSYYKNITDTVFLLDVKELSDYVINRGGEFRREPIEEALINSGEKYDKTQNIRQFMKEQNVKHWFYWLDTPDAQYSSGVRLVSHKQEISGDDAFIGAVGIAPALYLKSGINTSGGTGSIDSPYIVTGTDAKAQTNTVSDSAPHKPSSPTVFSIAISGTNAKLKWSAVKDAAYYYVYYRGEKSQTYKKLKVTTITCQLTGLTKGTKYYFRVTAANAAGESKSTAEVSKVTGK